MSDIEEEPKTIWTGTDHVPYKPHVAWDMYIKKQVAIQLKRIADLLEKAQDV